MLKETYLKHRIRFCGKKKGRVIGGLLFYLKQKYGFQYPEKGYVTQEMIATVLKTAIPTVREGYYDWLKLLPSESLKSW